MPLPPRSRQTARAGGGRSCSAAIRQQHLARKPEYMHGRVQSPSICQRSIVGARNRLAWRNLISMQTLETTDAKVARRCRYDQHRFQKTTLTIGGSLVTGLVRSVLEIRSSNPTRWILTIVDKPGIAVRASPSQSPDDVLTRSAGTVTSGRTRTLNRVRLQPSGTPEKRA
jgi:hypothetical protein